MIGTYLALVWRGMDLTVKFTPGRPGTREDPPEDGEVEIDEGPDEAFKLIENDDNYNDLLMKCEEKYDDMVSSYDPPEP
jgi:hypothetical protein